MQTLSDVPEDCQQAQDGKVGRYTEVGLNLPCPPWWISLDHLGRLIKDLGGDRDAELLGCL